MPAEIVLQHSKEEVALVEKRERLAAVRNELAEREAELVQLRAQLKHFEGRYLQQVGVLYAELDELEARLVEREVALYDSEEARQRANEARRRAQESHEAAFGAAGENAEEFDPPADLKAIFREVAKRIHPDFARDAAEQQYLHVLMARANQAYRRGDTEMLQRMLDDHRELNQAVAGESRAAEALRLSRQIQHAERDIARLEGERESLLGSEVAQLHADAETAAREHRDLLAELASGLREQIAEAVGRFERVDHQIRAHGR